MDTHCVGFPPSIDAGCRVLVLGSMPSVKSLAAQQYYAHPQNRFWPLMALLLTGAAEPPADYGERLHLLLSHHIALWDAIAATISPRSSRRIPRSIPSASTVRNHINASAATTGRS